MKMCDEDGYEVRYEALAMGFRLALFTSEGFLNVPDINFESYDYCLSIQPIVSIMNAEECQETVTIYIAHLIWKLKAIPCVAVRNMQSILISLGLDESV
jgi:hypothetical protein